MMKRFLMAFCAAAFALGATFSFAAAASSASGATAPAVNPSSALPEEAVPLAQDPATQKRAVDLELTLRCLVCQNQSIAESDADLAKDLRRQVRQMIAEGKTDAQIVKFMTDRYGDFVLYKPPFKGNTVVLWVGPIVLLLLGFIALFYFIRRYSRAAGKSVEPLSPQEKERAAALLEGRDR